MNLAKNLMTKPLVVLLTLVISSTSFGQVIASFENEDHQRHPCDKYALLRNTSTLDRGDSLKLAIWDFGDGILDTSLTYVEHIFSKFGRHNIQLYVESYRGYKDSVLQEIFFPGPIPRFRYLDSTVNVLDDTLVVVLGDSVTVLNSTNATKLNAPSWVLHWGNGTTSSTTNLQKRFKHVYKDTGLYSPYLYMEDTVALYPNRCWAIYPDSNLLSLNKAHIKVVPSTAGGIKRPMQETLVQVTNPISESMIINFTQQSSEITIQLKTLNGTIVLMEQVSNKSSVELNTSNLPSGIYYLHWSTPHIQGVDKVQKI